MERKHRQGAVAPKADKAALGRLLLAVLAVAAAAVVALTALPSPAGAAAQEGREAYDGAHAGEQRLMDCSDIATQRGAQVLFELDPEDRFGLDGDGDGKACETPGGSTAAEDDTRLGAETGGDLDCVDFPSQAAAQGRLRSDPSDPLNLDPEENGVACDIVPAEYGDKAEDLSPVAGARSGEDLDCADFEYRQEAQTAYFLDSSDPHGLDRGENGSDVCPDLPLLWSNVEPVAAEAGGGPAGLLASAAEAAPEGRVALLANLAALVLVVSGASVLLVVAGRLRAGAET
jgi:hypothetical protein